MPENISIVVNGEQQTIADGQSALELLSGLDLDPRTVVVEINREIVRRARLGDTNIRDGDHIELVHFVGGG
ncbi:MAG: sulfur carrier protein ThiS [Gemmatimonadetes bacterium]|nr:sulfur carrier protein ThiS [Gemmatimonadota bacterium]